MRSLNPLRWLDKPIEKRSESYTTLVTRALEAAAGGSGSVLADRTAAAETSAGWWGRGMALANVNPSRSPKTRCLDATTLGSIGRALSRRGEIVFLIGVENGEVVLDEAVCFRNHRWSPTEHLAVQLATCRAYSSPDDNSTIRRRSYISATAWDPRRPWQGLSPSESASSTSRDC